MFSFRTCFLWAGLVCAGLATSAVRASAQPEVSWGEGETVYTCSYDLMELGGYSGEQDTYLRTVTSSAAGGIFDGLRNAKGNAYQDCQQAGRDHGGGTYCKFRGCSERPLGQ